MKNKDTFRSVQDRLFDLAEQKRQNRVYNPDGTRLPNQLFEMADIVHILAGIIAAQQEELDALKSRLGSR